MVRGCAVNFYDNKYAFPPTETRVIFPLLIVSSHTDTTLLCSCDIGLSAAHDQEYTFFFFFFPRRRYGRSSMQIRFFFFFFYVKLPHCNVWPMWLTYGLVNKWYVKEMQQTESSGNEQCLVSVYLQCFAQNILLVIFVFVQLRLHGRDIGNWANHKRRAYILIPFNPLCGHGTHKPNTPIKAINNNRFFILC